MGVVRLRLSRLGWKNRPFYRIVAADSRCPRDGKYIEALGYFDPFPCPDGGKRMGLKYERVKYWLGIGAQPSDPLLILLFRAGLLPRTPKMIFNRSAGRIVRRLDPVTKRVIPEMFQRDLKKIPSREVRTEITEK